MSDKRVSQMSEIADRRRGGDISAIFVHAGAGYHSTQNEQIHLDACRAACKAAMRVLRRGGSAVDGVEAAIEILENKDITNAGYGSNLAMDGMVEGDATIVDHLGRSGAVGAVSQIKNPICLARIIYDRAQKQLSLHRVPPNLLVSQGATDFAAKNGMKIYPPEALVSKGARERWVRWKQELDQASESSSQQDTASTAAGSPLAVDPLLVQQVQEQQRRQYTQALLSPLPQTDYISSRQPIRDSSFSPGPLSQSTAETPRSTVTSPMTPTEQPVIPGHNISGPVTTDTKMASVDDELLSVFSPGSIRGVDGDSGSFASGSDDDETVGFDDNYEWMVAERDQARRNVSAEQLFGYDSDGMPMMPSITPSPTRAGSNVSSPSSSSPQTKASEQYFTAAEGVALARGVLQDRSDLITDTVGAIAIDSQGNIAAGSSSGGIGMKHRGRMGPAALVGVGTAVIPCDPEDRYKRSAAAVTSGTGEHMATTMAASVCADRVYSGTRKRHGRLERCHEDAALQNFIDVEFMGHPAVRESSSAGAIGILALTKTRDGVYFYFGHNTDSFAVASMSSEDTSPHATMSRNKGRGETAMGGRAARYRAKR